MKTFLISEVTGHFWAELWFSPNLDRLETKPSVLFYLFVKLTALKLKIRKQMVPVTVKTPFLYAAHNSLHWLKTLSVLFHPRES